MTDSLKPKYYKVTIANDHAIAQIMKPDVFIPAKKADYIILSSAVANANRLLEGTDTKTLKVLIAQDIIGKELGKADVLFDIASESVLNKQKGIYFIEQKTMPNILKIGYTKDLKRRTAELKRKNKSDCYVRALIVCDEDSLALLELAYHWYFNAAHMFEEWFDSSPLLWYINSTLKQLT